MADTIYFDISDLLLFAMKNNRVSGIQRVIIRVLAAYQRYSTETQVRFITFHPILNQVVEVDSSWLRKLEEFESDEMKSYFYLTDKIALSNSKRPIEFFRDVFHFYKIKLGILK